MGGIPVGTRLKTDAELHRHRFTVMLTDDETEMLYDLANEWDDLFSRVFRKCFRIVCAMDESERRKWFMRS